MNSDLLTQPVAEAASKRCSKCHRPLRSAQSIEIGFGPVCAEKMGIPYPSKSSIQSCGRCHGTGVVEVLDSDGDVVPDACPACGGTQNGGDDLLNHAVPESMPVRIGYMDGQEYAIYADGRAEAIDESTAMQLANDMAINEIEF